MKTPRKISIIITMLSFLAAGKAQTVSYTYDASGNRETRTIVMGGGLKSEVSQNEEMDKDEEEIYQETLEKMIINIYPNPTTGKLSIRFDNRPEDVKTSVTVYDLNAKIICRKTNIPETSEIDLSQEPAGNYILVIRVGERVSRWQVVKQ